MCLRPGAQRREVHPHAQATYVSNAQRASQVGADGFPSHRHQPCASDSHSKPLESPGMNPSRPCLYVVASVRFSRKTLASVWPSVPRCTNCGKVAVPREGALQAPFNCTRVAESQTRMCHSSARLAAVSLRNAGVNSAFHIRCVMAWAWRWFSLCNSWLTPLPVSRRQHDPMEDLRF